MTTMVLIYLAFASVRLLLSKNRIEIKAEFCFVLQYQKRRNSLLFYKLKRKTMIVLIYLAIFKCIIRKLDSFVLLLFPG